MAYRGSEWLATTDQAGGTATAFTTSYSFFIRTICIHAQLAFWLSSYC
ncbi:hypothetical protein QTO02_17870 [Vibrio fortis]